MTYWLLATCIVGLVIALWRSIGWIWWEPTTLDRLRAVVKAEK